MTFINQDPEEEELTTEKGCFNCGRFKKCRHIESEKRKGRDFFEIEEWSDGTEFRFGCSCDNYDPKPQKETVQFT